MRVGYVTLGTNNLERACEFYDGLMGTISFTRIWDDGKLIIWGKSMEEAAQEAVKANGVALGDIDVFIPHQANMRILKAVSQRLGLAQEKLMINLDKFGNTSAASIPLALDEAVLSQRIQKGHLVLLAAFGAGLTWASVLVRW